MTRTDTANVLPTACDASGTPALLPRSTSPTPGNRFGANCAVPTAPTTSSALMVRVLRASSLASNVTLPVVALTGAASALLVAYVTRFGKLMLPLLNRLLLSHWLLSDSVTPNVACAVEPAVRLSVDGNEMPLMLRIVSFVVVTVTVSALETTAPA